MLITGFNRLVILSSLIFAGRKRVKIDCLFCEERVKNNYHQFMVQIMHKRLNFYWEGRLRRERVKLNFKNFFKGGEGSNLSSNFDSKKRVN